MNDRPDLLIVEASARLIDAIDVIKRNRSRCAVVVEQDKVVGVISEGDVLRALLRDADVHAPIADWLNHGFKFLASFDHAAALELMRIHGISMVPIIDNSFRLQGVITTGDILRRVKLDIDEQPC